MRASGSGGDGHNEYAYILKTRPSHPIGHLERPRDTCIRTPLALFCRASPHRSRPPPPQVGVGARVLGSEDKREQGYVSTLKVPGVGGIMGVHAALA